LLAHRKLSAFAACASRSSICVTFSVARRCQECEVQF
jgi:hypothetical protein